MMAVQEVSHWHLARQGFMALIEIGDLPSWAASRAGERDLPAMLKALIYASVRPEKVRMPAGDSVRLTGFDGVVVSGEAEISEARQFVPVGISVWELGTDADYQDKASEDFEKRSKRSDVGDGEEYKILGKYDRSQVIYVAATPRVWMDYVRPAKAKRKSNRKSKDQWI